VVAAKKAKVAISQRRRLLQLLGKI